MNDQFFGYFDIPTIPKDFLSQMVEKIDLNEAFSEELKRVQEKPLISINEYIQLFNLLSKSLDDEMLGLLPKPVPIESYKALCHMLYSSPDLYTAIENYNRFYSLFLSNGAQLLELSQFRDRQIITINVDLARTASPFFQQLIVSCLLKIPAWLSNSKMSLQSLDFNFEAMPFNEEFHYLFGVIPSYSKPCTSLSFHASSLELPIYPKISPMEFGNSFIENMLYWSTQDNLVQKVYGEIAGRLESGVFDVVTISESMLTSKHTLSRRLKVCNSSYSDILAKVRKDKAKHLLLNTNHTVEYISELLGFSEFGSFSRAFKLWTGVSPRHYRDKHNLAKNG